jgi:hypothetical protein
VVRVHAPPSHLRQPECPTVWEILKSWEGKKQIFQLFFEFVFFWGRNLRKGKEEKFERELLVVIGTHLF